MRWRAPFHNVVAAQTVHCATRYTFLKHVAAAATVWPIWVRGKWSGADQDLRIDYLDPTHNADLTAAAALIKSRRSSARRLKTTDSQSADRDRPLEAPMRDRGSTDRRQV